MKKAFYTEPLIEEIEVAIENGIAQSDSQLPGYTGPNENDEDDN